MGRHLLVRKMGDSWTTRLSCRMASSEGKISSGSRPKILLGVDQLIFNMGHLLWGRPTPCGSAGCRPIGGKGRPGIKNPYLPWDDTLTPRDPGEEPPSGSFPRMGPSE